MSHYIVASLLSMPDPAPSSLHTDNHCDKHCGRTGLVSTELGTGASVSSPVALHEPCSINLFDVLEALIL